MAAPSLAGPIETAGGNWRTAICLAVILGLGLFLRLVQAGESLWLDELHTSWVVAGAWAEIPGRAADGNQSPLFFLLVRLVVDGLGDREWALRLISLVSGSALILSVYLVVRQWTGRTQSALLAAALIAIQSDALFYAQEARPYGLLQLLAVWHGWLLIRTVERPRGTDRMLLVLGAIALYYLHYTASLFLLAEAFYLVRRWSLKKGDAGEHDVGNRAAGNHDVGNHGAGNHGTRHHPACGYLGRRLLFDASVVLVAIGPSLPHLRQIAARRANWARIVAPWPSASLIWLAILMVVLPWLFVWWEHRCHRYPGHSGGRPGDDRSPDPAARSWAAIWTIVPPSLAWFGTLTGLAALGMLRYFVTSLPAVVVLAAIGHASLHSRSMRRLLAVCLIAGTLVPFGPFAQRIRTGRWVSDRNEDWRAATRRLDVQWSADPVPVFTCSGLLEDRAIAAPVPPRLRTYCLFPVSGIYRLAAHPVEPLPTRRDLRLSDAQRHDIATAGGAWFLIRASRSTTSTMLQRIGESLQAEGRRVTIWPSHRFGILSITRFSLRRRAGIQVQVGPSTD